MRIIRLKSLKQLTPQELSELKSMGVCIHSQTIMATLDPPVRYLYDEHSDTEERSEQKPYSK